MVILSGCSNAPEADDTVPHIESMWEPCKAITKLDYVKKTNGIDHGNTYQIDVEFGVKMLTDVSQPFKGLYYIQDTKLFRGCGGINAPYRLLLEHQKTADGENLKEGNTYSFNASFNMIKSENGWVVVE